MASRGRFGYDRAITMKIGIFVIAFNAERHIQRTLERIPEEVWRQVEVVYLIDDCSTDETVEQALAGNRWGDKLVILRNPVNRRYGGNQKVGYQYAIDRGLDAVVMLHGDGQYAPEHLSRMMEPLLRNEADVVLGSRMMQKAGALAGGMPKYKFLGNIVLTRIENAITGMRLSEFHSGYRAYRTSLLASIPFWENSDEWHFDTQILLQAHEVGGRIHEIPMPTYYGDEVCHVNGMAYAMNCIATAIGYRLHKRGGFYSRRYDVAQGGLHYGEKFRDPYSSHSLLWKRISDMPLASMKVLELGVGDAALTRRLHEAGAIVDGVEIDQRAVAAARPYCRTMYEVDLNRPAAAGIQGEYDLVIAADVLEHLHRPEVALAHLKRVLKKGGTLLVSLPNVANVYVRSNMLLGRFPRHTKGILDDTHLQFYTLKQMRRLLSRTGWKVQRAFVTSIPVIVVFPFLNKAFFRPFIHLLHGLTLLMPGLLGYQGCFVCVNPNKAAQLPVGKPTAGEG